MKRFDHRKYRPFAAVPMPHRRWPDRTIGSAPRWCSVDLRDGNQSLLEPMNVAQKMALFELLVGVGFKEIEVGFPAASQHDFDFVRRIIEHDSIPADVTIGVLTQARDDLIARTFESLRGARRAIVHLYNSTSALQRERVFGLDRAAIVEMATQGARAMTVAARAQPGTDWVFQYSPESFSGTELDFAVEICDAVIDVWQPTRERPAIINLPATVEMSTPNVYADQVEWFCSHISRRERLIISLHTHNDRGCAVAAAELGVMAGADRVEGTLLGNGERTGNMDIVTMAMNLYSQGVDPRLDLSRMDEIIGTVTRCTGLPVHPRHPYAGELVFTAFSGSHQDAISKSLARQRDDEPWQVAYLPIDPRDLGRSYQEWVRINSQSGKGGIAHIMEREHGLSLPRWLQIDFSAQVQRHAETSPGEVTAATLRQIFDRRYLDSAGPWQLQGYRSTRHGQRHEIAVDLRQGSRALSLTAEGNGTLDSFVRALEQACGSAIVIVNFAEHALARTTAASAIAYVELSVDRRRVCGAGCSSDVVEASMLAALSALNRSLPGDCTAAA